VIADVVCLSLGFVLRVFGGCAAVGIAPTTWLLNCTLFFAMFLAFGKRLGERRTLGADAAAARTVQAGYTDDLLRMAVVVTGVATLVIYAAYVQSREAWVKDLLARAIHPHGAWFNVLWLTMLPATYALLRSIVLLERGRFDDPTELAVKDRATQLAGFVFVLIVVGLIALTRV
jgi:4-hydroxybenzoate polyprenyltransferase